MPRGHPAKREAKKPKSKDEKKLVASPPLISPSQVEVVGKRRKTKEREE